MEKVYPADYFLLARQIKMRQIDEFLMSARITAHPYTDEDSAKEFIDDLLNQRAWYRDDPEARDKMDRGAIERFKQQVRGESRFGKVRQKGEEKPEGVLE